MLTAWATSPFLPARALTAYSCDSPQANYTAISLYEAAPCPDPKTSYHKPETRRVQIIQAGQKLEVRGWACQASHSVIHRICGWDSLSYGSGGDNIYAEPLGISGPECAHAANYGRITIQGRTMHVQRGHVSKESWWTQGEESSDGTCYPDSFSFKGKYYPSATQKMYISFKIVEVIGKLNLASGQVAFPNGVRGDYHTGWVEDAAEGTLVWKTREESCIATLSEVFRGQATIRRRNDLGSTLSLDGSILQVADAHTEQFAGFLIKERVPMCGRLCYQTQVEGALACFYEDKKPLFPYLSFRKDVYSGYASLESKLGGLFIDTNVRMYQYFEDLHSDICKVERMVLSNTLLDLAGGNNLALLHMIGFGYDITTVGATAYITKCEGIQATVRQHQNNCTLETPIILEDGTQTFMNSLTRIIQRFPTIIPCSPITPARFRLSGDWWCQYPALMTCYAPAQLNTTSGRFEAQVFTENMKGGMYSQEQIETHKRWAEVNAARSPLLQMITDRATGRILTGSPHQFGSIVGQKEMEDISWGVTSILFPIVPVLGRIWLHVSGFILLAFVVRVILDGLWHAWDIYQHHGWSFKLLGACWSTAHGIIMSPRAMFNASRRELKEIRGAVNRMYHARFAGKEVEEPEEIEGLPLPEEDEDRRAADKQRQRNRRRRRRWRGLYPRLNRSTSSSSDEESRLRKKGATGAASA